MAEAQLGPDPSVDDDAATKAYVDGALKYPGITNTTTAAGTTTLTVSSSQVQVFTGTTTQIVVLPTTSITAGYQTMVVNNSTGAVTVQASNTSTVIVLAAGTNAILTAGVNTPTSPSDWFCQYGGVSVVSGSALQVVGNAQVGGAQTAYVATSESTSSTTYTDLTTTTDAVTVTVGASGYAAVFLSAQFFDGSTVTCLVSFAASGANTIAADDSNAFGGYQWTAAAGAVTYAMGIPILLSGLTPGSTTFKMKYRVGGGTGNFSKRRIAVIPL